MPEPVPVTCPYCGESIEIMVDESEGTAAYVEDCPVCCRPIEVGVGVTDGHVTARVKTGSE